MVWFARLQLCLPAAALVLVWANINSRPAVLLAGLPCRQRGPDRKLVLRDDLLVRVVLQAVWKVNYLSSVLGIVQRDIKPDNFLVGAGS